jgi:hypothetical protein
MSTLSSGNARPGAVLAGHEGEQRRRTGREARKRRGARRRDAFIAASSEGLEDRERERAAYEHE